MVRIKSIGVKQSFKFSFFFYLIITLVIILPVILIGILIGASSESQKLFPMGGAIFGGFIFLILPVIYATLGGLMVAISAFLYNFVAKRVGGIEVDIDTSDNSEAKSEDLTSTKKPNT